MHDEKQPAVYIMANRYRGTVYAGVTGALFNRVQSYKEGTFEGFTKKYGLKTLAWYENHESMTEAILRESRIKSWKRQWKIELIETLNPDWIDLSDNLIHRPAS